jgi:hypothetical protein
MKSTEFISSNNKKAIELDSVSGFGFIFGLSGRLN